MKFEYKQLYIRASPTSPTSIAKLNEVGADGWEVCAVSIGGGPYDPTTTFLLKRKIVSRPKRNTK